MEVYKLLSSLLDLKRFCVSKITYFLSFIATNESKNEKYAKIGLYSTLPYFFLQIQQILLYIIDLFLRKYLILISQLLGML